MKAVATLLVTALGLTAFVVTPTQARPARSISGKQRLLVTVPVVRPAPYWDYNIVPRYRYRPEDDKVARCGPPVAQVIRYGAQEMTVPGYEGSASSGIIVCH